MGYARYSTAKLKISLRDSYILAIRWASDRIGKSGVIGVVTNAGWLEGNAMDGMRKCLAEEFSSVYVLNLRGNQRTQGERSRQEGGQVFGAGSRAPVAVTLFVRNPESTDKGCRILYHDIGDYLGREEKLDKVKGFRGIDGLAGQWTEIKPDTHHDWLNQRDAGFEKFMVLGDKRGRSEDVIFKNYSQGVKTNRDAWCYNYSEAALRWNIQAMIRFYESERQRLQEEVFMGRRLTSNEVTRFVNNDPTKISWTKDLKDDLARNKELSVQEGRITIAQYRPFTRQHLYHSRRLNQSIYRIPQLFPYEASENLVISVVSRGATVAFSCLLVAQIPDLECISKGQCFPRWLYSKSKENQDGLFVEGGHPNTDSHGYVRESAIKEEALQVFAEKMGGGIPLLRMTCSITSTAYSMSPLIGRNMPPISVRNCPASLSPKMFRNSTSWSNQEGNSENCTLTMRMSVSIPSPLKRGDGNPQMAHPPKRGSEWRIVQCAIQGKGGRKINPRSSITGRSPYRTFPKKPMTTWSTGNQPLHG